MMARMSMSFFSFFSRFVFTTVLAMMMMRCWHGVAAAAAAAAAAAMMVRRSSGNNSTALVWRQWKTLTVVAVLVVGG